MRSDAQDGTSLAGCLIGVVLAGILGGVPAAALAQDCIDYGTLPHRIGQGDLIGARNLAPETLEKQYKCVREFKQGDATRSVMALKCMVNGTEQSVLYGKTRYLCFELKKSMDKTQKRDDIPTRSDSY